MTNKKLPDNQITVYQTSDGKIDLLRNNTPHKNHALHLPVQHPQFSRTSGDNSTTHMISP